MAMPVAIIDLDSDSDEGEVQLVASPKRELAPAGGRIPSVRARSQKQSAGARKQTNVLAKENASSCLSGGHSKPDALRHGTGKRSRVKGLGSRHKASHDDELATNLVGQAITGDSMAYLTADVADLPADDPRLLFASPDSRGEAKRSRKMKEKGAKRAKGVEKAGRGGVEEEAEEEDGEEEGEGEEEEEEVILKQGKEEEDEEEEVSDDLFSYGEKDTPPPRWESMIDEGSSEPASNEGVPAVGISRTGEGLLLVEDEGGAGQRRLFGEESQADFPEAAGCSGRQQQQHRHHHHREQQQKGQGKRMEELRVGSGGGCAQVSGSDHSSIELNPIVAEVRRRRAELREMKHLLSEDGLQMMMDKERLKSQAISEAPETPSVRAAAESLAHVDASRDGSRFPEAGRGAAAGATAAGGFTWGVAVAGGGATAMENGIVPSIGLLRKKNVGEGEHAAWKESSGGRQQHLAKPQEKEAEVEEEKVPEEERIMLKISGPSMECQFRIARTENVSKLIRAYAKKATVSETLVRLSFDGMFLEANQVIDELDLEDEDMIEARHIG